MSAWSILGAGFLYVVVAAAAWLGVCSTRGLTVGGGRSVVPTTEPSRGRAPTVRWNPSRRVVGGMPGPLVYLVRLDAPHGSAERDLVKIGVAGDPAPGAAARRVRQWSTGSTHPLTYVALIPGGTELERALHEEFAGARTDRGREWFRLPEGDFSWAASVEAVAARVTAP